MTFAHSGGRKLRCKITGKRVRYTPSVTNLSDRPLRISTSSDFRPASRISGIELSEIVRISEAAAALVRQGKDVITLGTGEPDFPTPEHVIEAAHKAARSGATRYTPTSGTPELRATIAAQSGNSPSEVIVSNGAKQVIFNALLATLEPGDEVILAAPYWTSYVDMISVAGGVPVIVPCAGEKQYKLHADDLEAAITSRTRWILLNTPSNPAGAVYSPDEIANIAETVSRHDGIWVMSDEIYEHLCYVPFASFARHAPELSERTLSVNGVSKAWAMTGWRIGWGIGPAPLIRAMTVIQGQSTSGACSVSQAAALAALRGDPALLTERREIFRARRDVVVKGLAAIPRIECDRPDGAFYVFAACHDVLEPGRNAPATDSQLCTYLLDNAGVAVVPGSAFGMPGHFRLSYAYSQESLEQGILRISEAIRGLRQ